MADAVILTTCNEREKVRSPVEERRVMRTPPCRRR